MFFYYETVLCRISTNRNIRRYIQMIVLSLTFFNQLNQIIFDFKKNIIKECIKNNEVLYFANK